jgi:uncharacterized membrane-anchored protein YhcB (DUF1043 family)
LNKEKKEQTKTIQALKDEIKEMEDMWKEMNPNDYSEGELGVLISMKLHQKIQNMIIQILRRFCNLK